MFYCSPPSRSTNVFADYRSLFRLLRIIHIILFHFSHFTVTKKECFAKYWIWILRNSQFFGNIVTHYTVIKVIVSHFTNFFDFYFLKYSFRNYILFVILFRLLLFPQNTANSRFCYVNYNSYYCAKYRFSETLLRKIQELLLRKIKISPGIVAQITGPNVAFMLPKLQMLRKIQ